MTFFNLKVPGKCIVVFKGYKHFLDYLFMFSVHLPALSPLFIYGCSSPMLQYGVNL